MTFDFNALERYLRQEKETIVVEEMKRLCFTANTKDGLTVRDEAIMIDKASEYAERMIDGLIQKIKGGNA
jgi:site-specific recombinase XerD